MKKTLKVLLFTIIFLTSKSIIKAADYIWPIDEKNAYETYIEYNYGQRTYDSKAYDKKYPGGQLEGNYARSENHYGVDITGIKGHTYDVVSVVDGTVLTTSLDQIWNPSLSYPDRNQRNVSFDGGGYGNYIVIKESKTGKCFLYGHLKANTVTLRNGQKVTKGQKIGVMGSSGDSGHMHLHFEVRLNEQTTTTGKNLVITTRYGLETLDPTLYIGKTAPQKPVVEVIQEITHDIKPEVIESKQKNIEVVENTEANTLAHPIIEFTDYKTFGRIVIRYDKPITRLPGINVIIGDESRRPNLTDKPENISIYTVRYNDYNILTYGNIRIEIEQTDEIEHTSIVVGYLNEYKIPQTYEDAYYYRLGDLNKDGRVDAVDASQAMAIYSKISTDQPLTQEEQDKKTRADMNKDGRINSIDASLILNYYVNKSTNWTNEKQERIISCDLSNDHIIDGYDYQLLKAMINAVAKLNKPYDVKYDLNHDGAINEHDESYFLYTLKDFGKR